MAESINVREWRNKDVILADGGENLGKLENVYFDAASDEPVFLCVKSGWLRRKHVLIPVQDLNASSERLTVPWGKAEVAGAPTTRPGQKLAVEDEERVFRHYGMDYRPTPSGRRLFCR